MKQSERRAKSRAAILDAAFAEFGERGYAGATVDGVCARGSISKGMMYHYYKGKDELFCECVKEMFSALIHNDQAMVVVVGIVVFNASLYLTTQLAVYFFKYDIGNSDLFSLFGTVGGVGQILSMVSLPLLRQSWGGKQILAGALGVTIAGYLALFALSMAGVRAVAPLAATAFVIYIGFGLATVLTTVFLADTVDYGEYKTGRRNESVVFSMQTFVVKLASAVSVLIAGVGIDLIGLDDTAAVQTESTLLGLRLLMVALPVAGLVFSILYFVRKYRLTEAENARISEALRQREGSKG